MDKQCLPHTPLHKNSLRSNTNMFTISSKIHVWSYPLLIKIVFLTKRKANHILFFENVHFHLTNLTVNHKTQSYHKKRN